MELRHQYDLSQSLPTKLTPVKGGQFVSASDTAIAAAVSLTLGDSGGIFTAAQSSAYTITLPTPSGAAGPAGFEFTIQLVSPGAFDISIVATGCTFEGIIQNDVTSTLPATGSTLKFASGTAALGDTIRFRSTGAGKYNVLAISSANGGITVT